MISGNSGARGPGRRGGPAETAAGLRETCPVCSPSPQSGPVSLPELWMGRKRMEEQWWKGELAADIHQTLRTKVGSHFVPFPPPPRSPLRAFLPCRNARAPAHGGRAAKLPGLRLGVGKLAFGRSQRSRFAPSSSLYSRF